MFMWSSGAYGYFSDYLLWWVFFFSLLLHTACFFRCWRGDFRPRLRLAFGNVLVGLCLLGTVAILAETYLRFVSTSTEALGASLTTRRWQQAYVKLNSLYCRDREWLPAKPVHQNRVRRIAFVGDSFTYGWGIDRIEDRFTEIIQHRLEQHAPGRFEILNVAWAGWNTRQQFDFVQRQLPPYDVDEVILCYVPNDIEWLIPPSELDDPRVPLESQFFNTESSFLGDYLYYRVIAPRLRTGRSYFDFLAEAYGTTSLWERQKKLLLEFHRLCQSRRMTFRVALLPLLRTDAARFDASRVHAMLREFLDSAGVDFVDLLSVIPSHDSSELFVNRFDPHPNERAHRLFADAIWEAFFLPGFQSTEQ